MYKYYKKSNKKSKNNIKRKKKIIKDLASTTKSIKCFNIFYTQVTLLFTEILPAFYRIAKETGN